MVLVLLVLLVLAVITLLKAGIGLAAWSAVMTWIIVLCFAVLVGCSLFLALLMT